MKTSEMIRNKWDAEIMLQNDLIDQYRSCINDLETLCDPDSPRTQELIADYQRRIAHAERAIAEQKALRDWLVNEAEDLEAQQAVRS